VTVGAKTAALRIASNDSDEPTVSVALQGGGIDTNPCAAPDPAVALAQDVCAQAQLIGPATTYSGDFTGAISDGFSSCIAAGTVDVWFRYVAGTNALSVFVPNDAVITNLTFARFRLNSAGGLGVTAITHRKHAVFPATIVGPSPRANKRTADAERITGPPIDA